MPGNRRSGLGKLCLGWMGLVLLIAPACGGGTTKGTTGGGPEDAGWESRLGDTILAQPLYSLRFLDDGAIFGLAFVAGAPGASCSAFTQAVDAGTDYWALQVILPAAQIGVYPVVPPVLGRPESVSDAGALAFLAHQDSAARADFAFYATSGAVTISAGPEDGGAQGAGQQLSGSLTNLAFPAAPIVLGACQTTPAPSCTCDDLDGVSLSVCDGGPEGCCLGAKPTGLTISVPPFLATPCAVLCSSDVDPADCTSL